MRSRFTPKPGMVVVLAMSLAVVATGCEDAVLVPTCDSELDCAAGSVCRNGVCTQELQPVPEEDAGSPCELLCGAVCCTEGEACRGGFCVPDCPSQVWCGRYTHEEVCCPTGDVCGPEFVCVTPPEGPPHCDRGTWDPDLGACVDPIELRTCQQPPLPRYTPEVLWSFTPSDGFDQVMMQPLVADVNGDGAGDVLATFFSVDQNFNGPAVLRVLDGLSGRELWKTPLDGSPTPDGTVSLTVARLLEDGPLTVLAVESDGVLAAYEASNGRRLWRSRHKDGTPALCDVGQGAPAVANLDASGLPEIICGFTVFDAHGVMRWNGDLLAGGRWGSVVAVGDLNGDGLLDLTDGRTAYRHDGKLLWKSSETMSGLAAIADFLTTPWNLTLDGIPEVVVVRAGRLELLHGASGLPLVAPIFLPAWDGMACYPHGERTGGWGGPPAIADVNLDGLTDVVAASGECVAAMTLQREGAGIANWKMIWGHHAVDGTSSSTTAAIFDFDGIEGPDVVYADETKLHFLQGRLGAPVFELPHCSGTLYESPVVADVDGDGSANVVVASNTFSARAVGCSAAVQPGITVYREQQNRWTNARSIWNQHGYHPGVVCDGQDAVCESWEDWNVHGAVPFEIFEPWSPPLNTVRSNSHGPWSALGIPNAAVSHVLPDPSGCPDVQRLRVRVINSGEAPIRAGTPVTWESESGTRAQVALEKPLRPGASKVVTLRWTPAANPEDTGPSWVRVGPLRGQTDCDESDDVLMVTADLCVD